MTKEDLLKEFLLDDLVSEKGHISKERVKGLKYGAPSGSKLAEAIKLAIEGRKNQESVATISRKLNKYLNK